MNDDVRNLALYAIFGAVMAVGYQLARVNDNLELIADRIQEANMTYEEYCEYWPEKCEELF